MRSMGQPTRADVTCGLQGMDDEVRHHLQAACHEEDMEHDRQEAARHIAAMSNGLQHMQMRAGEVSEDSGHHGMGPGTMDPDHHPAGCPAGR